jgi:hypothetical protein
MVLATHMPLPVPSAATALSTEEATSSPGTTAAFAHIDQVIRRALGRSSFGAGVPGATEPNFSWRSIDDLIAFCFMIVFWLVVWLFLLAFKLILGMVLLNVARRRYKGMKEREKMDYETGARRVGGNGTVEVDDEKRKWIYKDAPEELKVLQAREKNSNAREKDLDGVHRYMMVAKRIW